VVAHATPLIREHTGVGRQGGGDTGTRPERADVVGRPVPLGAVQAEPAHAGVHETGVAGGHAGVVEPGSLEGVEAQVGDEHVGPGDQVLEHLAAALGAVVEADGPLAPIVELERRVHLVAEGRREVGRHPAERIARQRLDLHDVGAPVGQDAGAARPGDPEAELDDLDPLHRSCHAAPPDRQPPEI
jgi:hypothetical protein